MRLSPERLLGLPAAAELLGVVADDLAERRNVAVAPVGLPAELFLRGIRRELDRRQLEVVTVAAAEADGDPAAHLAGVLSVRHEALRAPWVAPAELDALPDVVWVTGVGTAGEEHAGAWLRWIGTWIAHCRRTPAARARVGVVVATPEVFAALPAADLHLTHRTSWGRPSELELRLLCRLAGEPGPRSAWLEHVVPALVGAELALAELVAEPCLESEDKILQALLSVARERGWTAPESLEAVALQRLHGGAAGLTAPHGRLAEFWLRGLVGATHEHGVQASAAALALAGESRELRHRLWRGQAELILPLLDTRRIHLCGKITERLGRDWPVSFARPESREEATEVEQDPLACQFGHLEGLLRNWPRLAPFSQALGWVSRAKSARNRLAHNRVLSFSEFRGFWDLTEQQRHAWDRL